MLVNEVAVSAVHEHQVRPVAELPARDVDVRPGVLIDVADGQGDRLLGFELERRHEPSVGGAEAGTQPVVAKLGNVGWGVAVEVRDLNRNYLLCEADVFPRAGLSALLAPSAP